MSANKNFMLATVILSVGVLGYMEMSKSSERPCTVQNDSGRFMLPNANAGYQTASFQGPIPQVKKEARTMIELRENNFNAEVLQSKEPVLVDFFAPWCGPCRAMTPVVEQLATDNAGNAKVGKIDIDKNPNLADTFQVTSIPTIIVYKDGKVVDRMVGVQSKKQLQAALDAVIR